MEEIKSIVLNGKYSKDNPIALVSKEYFDHLNEFSWYVSDCGYAMSCINKRKIAMHRYIWLHILNQNIDKGYIIDHIDRNKLNNTIDNLRILTYTENARNRNIKSETSKSKYQGVSFNSDCNKWISCIKIKEKNLSVLFEKEVHAAYQYNLWCKEFNLEGGILNDIETPTDFFIKNKKNKELPKHITMKNNKYLLRICIKGNVYSESFHTLEEALATKQYRMELENDENEKNIYYNSDGLHILKIKNQEILIDEEDYNALSRIKWEICKGYVKGKINGTHIRLSRYIMKCNDRELVVDHINGNRFDNRKENLRICTQQQNACNTHRQKLPKSGYRGVMQTNKKWSAVITKNGIKTYLGTYNTKEEAAKSYDNASKQIHGEYGILNFQ